MTLLGRFTLTQAQIDFLVRWEQDRPAYVSQPADRKARELGILAVCGHRPKVYESSSFFLCSDGSTSTKWVGSVIRDEIVKLGN